jgi:hypothetical protein
MLWRSQSAKPIGDFMTVKSFSGLEVGPYLNDLAMIARLSPLFSDSSVPFVHSRFAERLFCSISGSSDLGRRDLSFDAKARSGAGIGVKTFVSRKGETSKVEKVAEFTSLAAQGGLQGLKGEGLARKISDMRNARIRSDAAETGIDLTNSYYHCVVRIPGGIYLLEDSYSEVQVSRLSPTDKYGTAVGNFSASGHVYFNDGLSDYVYNVAKNVLLKRFDPSKSFTSSLIETESNLDLPSLIAKLRDTFGGEDTSRVVNEHLDEIEAPFVVLPLYTPKSKSVAEASGINQWNANGRARTFGEAYIPVPRAVHDHSPGFFPPRDSLFKVKLPTGQVISAKICQDGDKALMANPNTDLCKWLFSTIDGNYSVAEQRLADRRPYKYSDFEKIGKDSVAIFKSSGPEFDYVMKSAPIGAYEDFIEN